MGENPSLKWMMKIGVPSIYGNIWKHLETPIWLLTISGGEEFRETKERKRLRLELNWTSLVATACQSRPPSPRITNKNRRLSNIETKLRILGAWRLPCSHQPMQREVSESDVCFRMMPEAEWREHVPVPNYFPWTKAATSESGIDPWDDQSPALGIVRAGLSPFQQTRNQWALSQNVESVGMCRVWSSLSRLQLFVLMKWSKYIFSRSHASHIMSHLQLLGRDMHLLKPVNTSRVSMQKYAKGKGISQRVKQTTASSWTLPASSASHGDKKDCRTRELHLVFACFACACSGHCEATQSEVPVSKIVKTSAVHLQHQLAIVHGRLGKKHPWFFWCCWRMDQIHPYVTGWWLGKNPSEKYEFVNWDDEIPSMWENAKHGKQTTNQVSNVSFFWEMFPWDFSHGFIH